MDEMLRSLNAMADEIERRMDSCHEFVACPKCGEPIGKRCVLVRRGNKYGSRLKHPHRERWTLVVDR
jgi:predicted RNA-binding Zn-ribbon protein involved in translation (DUF1610 family)